MPVLPFATENRISSGPDYPTLKLGLEERARICIADEDPTFEFVHTLRAPIIGPDGKPVFKMEQTSKGEDREVMQWEFVGRHLCPGKLDILLNKGFDSDDCPTCRRAQITAALQPPERKFAIHAVRYVNLRAGSFDLLEPFALMMVAWVLNAKIFNQLIDTKNEHGDLRKIDLLLGPCKQVQFQKFDIQVGSVAQFSQSESRINFWRELMQNGKCENLSALLGRAFKHEYVMQDIAKCEARYNQAFPDPEREAELRGLHAATAAGSDAAAATILNESFEAPDIDALLAQPSSTPAADTVPIAPMTVADATPAATETPPLEVTPPATPSTAEFDDLLNSLK